MVDINRPARIYYFRRYFRRSSSLHLQVEYPVEFHIRIDIEHAQKRCHQYSLLRFRRFDMIDVLIALCGGHIERVEQRHSQPFVYHILPGLMLVHTERISGAVYQPGDQIAHLQPVRFLAVHEVHRSGPHIQLMPQGLSHQHRRPYSRR